MKKLLLSAVLAASMCLAACANAQTAQPSPGIVVNSMIGDFTAAQADYTAAAAAQPAGSALAAAFTNNAQCMATTVAKFQGLTASSSSQVKGLFSLASTIDIQIETAKANLAAGGSAACEQLVGHIIMGLNGQALSALPGALLPIKLP